MTTMKTRLKSLAVASLAALIAATPTASQSVVEAVTLPVISEDASPIELVSPVANDGHRGQALLRRPPGAGPFPAVVWIHGGLATRPLESLRQSIVSPNPARFLAAGYVVAVITYRGRDEDPQAQASRDDSLAALEHVRRLPYVDPKSVVVSGCSGGGDLALEIAAATDVAAIAAEEPASVLFTGVYNRAVPKIGERYTPEDAAQFSAEPRRYYTAPYQVRTREKVSRIRAPILILQGDQASINRFNAEVLIPELRSAGKAPKVITYPGEPHCFAFYGAGPRTPRPAAALEAFEDTDRFFRRHLHTQPKPIERKLVKLVPIS